MSASLLLSGLPGRMATEVAQAFAQNPIPSVALLDIALSGPSHHGTYIEIAGRTFALRGPDHRPTELPDDTVAIDFSTPDSALPNIAWYTQRQIPFVMGATGFDNAQAHRLVKASAVPAVIAPNMAIPIVLIQTALANLAHNYPDALTGYTVRIRESHQAGKKDTSGTAKALVQSFQQLGLPTSENAIHQERDPHAQLTQWKVPPAHISGHAYHYYDIESEDGTVRLSLSHCVHGRRVYAEGALRALQFILQRVHEGTRGQIYTMTDVLTQQLP